MRHCAAAPCDGVRGCLRAPETPGGDGGDHVDEDGGGEELLASETVGQPTEDERPEYRPENLGAAGQADLGGGEVEPVLVGDRRRQRPYQGHLQAIENPGHPLGGDHQPVDRLQGSRSSRAGTRVTKTSGLAIGSPLPKLGVNA